MPRRLTHERMVGETRDPLLLRGWVEEYQLIGERLAEARGRARSSAKIRQTSEVAQATECVLHVFDQWGESRGEGGESQKWLAWAPLCEAMTAHAAARGGETDAAGVGGTEEWTQALLLLHDCNRAVTVSKDRHYLILHRDLLTEYAQTDGSASA